MTRIILLLAAVLMSGILRAQHIKFMGIPIEGTMEEFAAKLEENKGF